MSKRFYFDEFSEDIFDDEIQQYPSNQTICNILNQQQQRIAELEEQLKNSLGSNNNMLKQIMELEAQLIKERLKGENK